MSGSAWVFSFFLTPLDLIALAVLVMAGTLTLAFLADRLRKRV